MASAQRFPRVRRKDLFVLAFAATYLFIYATNPELLEGWFRVAFNAIDPAFEGAGEWLAQRFVPSS